MRNCGMFWRSSSLVYYRKLLRSCFWCLNSSRKGSFRQPFPMFSFHFCLHSAIYPFTIPFNALRLSSTHYLRPFQVSATFWWYRSFSGWYSVSLVSNCSPESSKNASIKLVKEFQLTLFQTKQNVSAFRRNILGGMPRPILITFSMVSLHFFLWYVAKLNRV